MTHPLTTPTDVGATAQRQKALRVAFMYGDYPPKAAGKADGGSDFLASLSDELVRAGVDVTVIVSERDDRGGGYATPTGVRVLPVIEDWSLRRPRRQFSLLRKLLAESAPDIVHLIYPDPYLRYGSDNYHLPFLLKAAGARRLVVTFFGFGVTGASFMTKCGLLTLFGSADRVVITDADLLALFRKAFPFWRSKSRSGLVGSIALDDAPTWSRSTVEAGRRELGLPANIPCIGFFGFWTPDKGLEELLEATKLLRDGGVVMHLVLVGGRGKSERTKYEQHIANRIAQLSLEDTVIETGPLAVKDVVRHLMAVEMCALPFRVNPLGRSSLAMALALGVPTIVTSPKSRSHLVKDLPQVQPRDPKSLANAIHRLIDDDVARETASAAARRASVNWSWESVAAAYMKIYSELPVSP